MAVSGDISQHYQKSQASQYRRKIASLAEPLPERITKGIELARVAERAMPHCDGVFLDLPAYWKEAMAFKAIGTKHGLVPKEPPTGDALEDTRRVFHDNGILFDAGLERVTIGMIMETRNVCGAEVHTAGLVNVSEMASVYSPRIKDEWFYEGSTRPLTAPATVVLNTTTILEEAVFRINMFRHRELEQMGSLLLVGAEAKAPDMALFRRRLDSLVPMGRFRRDAFGTLLRRMSKKARDSHVPQGIRPRLLAMRFLGCPVIATHTEDEVGHTVALANLIARSTLTAQLAYHCEVERCREERGMPPARRELGELIERRGSIMTFLSWLADVAYGSPHVRLGDVQRSIISRAVSGQEPSPAEALFTDRAVTPMLVGLGLVPASASDADMGDMYYDLLSCPEERFRAVAAWLLDRAYLENTGKDFFGNFPELRQAYGQLGQENLIRRVDLPSIAWIWREALLAERLG